MRITNEINSTHHEIREEQRKARHAVTLHPTPYTLHPTPYALHPTPYTLHHKPYTLHPTP